MSLYVFISEDAIWVHPLQDIQEVIKPWIESLEVTRTQVVRLGPMWPPLMASKYSLEHFKKCSIGNVKPVGSRQSWLAVGLKETTDYVTHLYWTIPIQQVSWPRLGLSQMSSGAENRISIGKWGRNPSETESSCWSQERKSCKQAWVLVYGIAHSVVNCGNCVRHVS